jgi:diketogulonate reductase-like aldo/keto reductase
MKESLLYTLSNGVEIPAIGFGTWQIPNGEIAYDSVLFALKTGYRHIDTALAYGNEESVGKAVRDSGIDRSEIFITSKLPAEIKSYERSLECFDKTLENLHFDYIDLYLIHAPWPWTEIGADYTSENVSIWKAMEKIYKEGRSRAIGISNFNVKDIKAILANCEIRPMADQIKFYIGHTQEEITQFCKENNILVEAYSPLASGKILNNEVIKTIAKKYMVSLPQLCISYALQRETLPLPKSTHHDRIAQNADLDFNISKEDMIYLDSVGTM